MLIILTSVLLALAQPRFLTPSENEVPGGRQLTGLVTLDVAGKPVPKRYVLRLPARWNGALLVGAHGGSGGDAVDRQGNVRALGSSDRALDDVIGDYAFANGFAY